MVGTKALKENECATIEDYYKKIIELTTNKNKKEAIALIEKLSEQQKTHLLSMVWDGKNIGGEIAFDIADMMLKYYG